MTPQAWHRASFLVKPQTGQHVLRVRLMILYSCRYVGVSEGFGRWSWRKESGVKFTESSTRRRECQIVA